MDLKFATGADRSKAAKKFDLVSLKSEIDRFDIDKLETTLVDLHNLSENIVKNFAVAKKNEYNDFFLKKGNAIQVDDVNNLVKKVTMTQKLMKLTRKLLIMIIVISKEFKE